MADYEQAADPHNEAHPGQSNRISDPTAWGISDYADPTSTYGGALKSNAPHAQNFGDYDHTAEGELNDLDNAMPQDSNDILVERWVTSSFFLNTKSGIIVCILVVKILAHIIRSGSCMQSQQ